MDQNELIEKSMTISSHITEENFKNQNSILNHHSYQYRAGAMDATLRILKEFNNHVHPSIMKEIVEKLKNEN